VTEDRRKLHNEEFDDFHFSQNGIGIIKVKGMRCLGHVACIAEMRNPYKLWSENLITWKITV